MVNCQLVHVWYLNMRMVKIHGLFLQVKDIFNRVENGSDAQDYLGHFCLHEPESSKIWMT